MFELLCPDIFRLCTPCTMFEHCYLDIGHWDMLYRRKQQLIPLMDNIYLLDTKRSLCNQNNNCNLYTNRCYDTTVCNDRICCCTTMNIQPNDVQDGQLPVFVQLPPPCDSPIETDHCQATKVRVSFHHCESSIPTL